MARQNHSFCQLALICFASMAFLLPCHGRADSEIDLPELGDSTSGLMSPAQEQALGQAWLRSFRASVPLESDPLLFEYVENLLFKLASQSQLQDRELDLVVVKNSTLNAFAVPGGIIGVHTGLILSAETEGQLASVLAHELAHLSQHHFARGVEAARQANLTALVGALAGIILASTAGGDAATAAIASSQAAALESRLRYSRAHESEADRIGTKTLVSAGYDAKTAVDMFKQMQNASRLYGNRVPEFLRTHPITESRIADAQSRARQANNQGAIDGIEYQLIRARVFIRAQESPGEAVKHFKRLLADIPIISNGGQKLLSSGENPDQLMGDAARYGLALAYNENGQWKKARETLKPLLNQMPGRIIYSLLDIEIDLEAGNSAFAEKRLRDLYSITPNNYAVGMLLAKTLMKHKHYGNAQKVLRQLTNTRPKQADVWYLLAEAEGLAGDILNLHRSRAEFFALRGNFSQAKYHLNYALKIAGDRFQQAARIKQRLKEVVRMERLSRQL